MMAHAGVALCSIDEIEAEKCISDFRRILLDIEIEDNYPINTDAK